MWLMPFSFSSHRHMHLPTHPHSEFAERRYADILIVLLISGIRTESELRWISGNQS